MSNKLGFQGIFNGYTVKRNIASCKSFIIAILSVGVCVWLFHTKDSLFVNSLLSKIADVFVGSIPDLLGFCIGGYAIIVAINGLERIPAFIKTQPQRGMSYYQILSADFALTLVLMCLLLLIAFFSRFIIDLEITAINDSVGRVTNLSIIAVFLWLGILSVIMLMETIANLFSTSIILQVAASVAGNTNEQNANNKKQSVVYRVKGWFGSFTVTLVDNKE